MPFKFFSITIHFHFITKGQVKLVKMRTISLILMFTFIAQLMAGDFEQRKANLIKILQSDGAYHSSYSFYHGNHYHKHHHYHSASVERAERKQFKKGVFYGKILSRSNPRRYSEYPCAYQPYYYIPYGNNYGPCRK